MFRRKNQTDDILETPIGDRADVESEEDSPEAHTSYLTTVDGAFEADPVEGRIIDVPLGEEDEDDEYAEAVVRGAHDAYGKAGAPKGSIVFGEGTPPEPRSFNLNDEGEREEAAHAPKASSHIAQTDPMSIDAVTDIEHDIAIEAGKHGKHRKHTAPDLPDHEIKSIKTRRILIAIIVALVALIVGLGVYTAYLIQTGKDIATETAARQSDNDKAQHGTVKDARTVTEAKVDMPRLSDLVGKTQAEAIAALGDNAKLTREVDVDEADNAVKHEMTYMLASDTSSTSGNPMVTLGMNEAGVVVKTGYSSTTAALSFGALSFADAVNTEHIIQKALGEAGVKVDDGAISLPDDRAAYTTFASDGATVLKESASFNGQEAGLTWSTVLTYDYTTSNISHDLSDTVRMIYVHVDA